MKTQILQAVGTVWCPKKNQVRTPEMEHHSDAINKMNVREVSEQAILKVHGRGDQSGERERQEEAVFLPSTRTQGARAQKKTNRRITETPSGGKNQVVKS